MTAYFVRSAAAGAGTGADWTNAYTTLAAAMSGKAAGSTYWVADDHAETSAVNNNPTAAGGGGLPLSLVYCVDHLIASPGSANLKTGGKITATGAGYIILSGSMYVHGITFDLTAGTSTSTSYFDTNGQYSVIVFNNCTFNPKSSLNMFSMSDGSNLYSECINCTFTLGASDISGTVPISNYRIKGGSITSSATTLIGNTGGNVELIGVNLSGFSGTNIFHDTSLSLPLTSNVLRDCRLPGGVTIQAPITLMPTGGFTYNIRSDSGATNYLGSVCSMQGSSFTETTVIRSGGATDGTTPVSWKITTTTYPTWLLPFKSISLQRNNTATGSTVTITVYGTWNSASLPNNDDIWIEAEYLGNASYPIGTIASSSKTDNLASGSALASDASTWGGGGSGVGWSPFKMTLTLDGGTWPTPKMAGYIFLTIKAAKASSTFYVDPLAILS